MSASGPNGTRERHDVVIVGAGHAGLAASYCLRQRGVEHVVLERRRIAERWRSERWDSFTLLTPNWATWLPGWRYTGNEPDGFMGREEVVEYLRGYAASFDAPVRQGTEVLALDPLATGSGYRVQTSTSVLEAGRIVLACGPCQRPAVPAIAANLPDDIAQLHSSDYRNSSQLPEGATLVVGGGASGQQLVEDLLRAGRSVYLSVGRLKSVPRRYRSRDFFWWAENAGFYDATVDMLPDGRPPHGPSPSLTGFAGGHDLNVRTLTALGATVVGRLAEVQGSQLRFGGNLADSLTAGDQAAADFAARVEAWLKKTGESAPDPEPAPTLADPPAVDFPVPELDLVEAGIRSIVWATGFARDYHWVHAPSFEHEGELIHHRGITQSPGIYVLGLPWLHRQRSPFIRGADEDAEHVAQHIADRVAAR